MHLYLPPIDQQSAFASLRCLLMAGLFLTAGCGEGKKPAAIHESNLPGNVSKQSPGDDGEGAKLAKCLANAKAIATACHLWAQDHSSAFPKDLNQLVPDYLPDRVALSSPLAPQPGQLDYEYLGAGGYATDSAEKILLVGQYTTKDGKRSVVRFNGIGNTEAL